MEWIGAACGERRFGVDCHVDHVGRLLHELGWSPQLPTRHAVERDESPIRRWVDETWLRVKKRLPPRRGGRLHRRSGIADGAAAAAYLGAARFNYMEVNGCFPQITSSRF
ncbi:MAG TPA: winged helix-turn-helix domain-containing protein [Casimicrobiaceae bacterium]